MRTIIVRALWYLGIATCLAAARIAKGSKRPITVSSPWHQKVLYIVEAKNGDRAN